MTSSSHRERGFALILALFLIVSLAAIGAYLLSVSNVQVESGIKDEQGARAYQAARAGLDWGAYRVLRNATCPAGPTTITFPADLAGFYAEVACTSFGLENEGGTPVTTYRIVSTGCNFTPCASGAGIATYVERQLLLTVAR
jgi:MSHA biogenesis protein MshP